MLPRDVQVLRDADAVAVEACRLIGEAAQAAIRQRGLFRLVLAGGATPRRTYERLAVTTQNWAKWEIFWGDERCLPAEHPERNSSGAIDAWLGRVDIPPTQIHGIGAERGAVAAAADYTQLLASCRPFDLVLLGMGEDGHTASLFPGALPASGAAVIAIHNAPKPPSERVSLNYDCLRDSRRQLVLVTGAGKAVALAAWRRGDPDSPLPIARAVRDDASLLVDQAAMLQDARCE